MMAFNLEAKTPPEMLETEDRKARLERYARRDRAVCEVLAAYLSRQLISSCTFREFYERALFETDPRAVRRLIFQGEDRIYGDLEDRQKFLRLPEQDILKLEEAIGILMPLLRRGKLPAVAKAHALSLRRATTGRLTSGI